MRQSADSTPQSATVLGRTSQVRKARDVAEDKQLSYMISGKEGRQLAFFIHGTPGLGSDWDAVLDCLDSDGIRCETIRFDRVGFGENSELGRGQSFAEQMEHFRSVLNEARDPSQELVLAGHSYGAALALGLANLLVEAQEVSGLVLVSGVLSPLEKQCRWYHKLLSAPGIASLAPKRYVRCAKEMDEVKDQLAQLEGAWERFDFPVTLIHGDEDSLIPLANSSYAMSRIDPRFSRLVVVDGGGHDLPRTHPRLIADEIRKILNSIAEEES